MHQELLPGEHRLVELHDLAVATDNFFWQFLYPYISIYMYICIYIYIYIFFFFFLVGGVVLQRET